MKINFEFKSVIKDKKVLLNYGGIDLMFETIFGINTNNIIKSDCFVNPEQYPSIFNDVEVIKNKGKDYKIFWHVISGFLHLCPKQKRLNFKKIKQSIENEENNFGIYNSFNQDDKHWIIPMLNVLIKTFPKYQTFYFEKWNNIKNETTTNIEINY